MESENEKIAMGGKKRKKEWERERERKEIAKNKYLDFMMPRIV